MPSTRVIVVANEKGGSGKSTVAMHIAVALIKSGQRVATVDLDARQKSFTILSRTGAPGPSRSLATSKSPIIFVLAKFIIQLPKMRRPDARR